MTHDKHNKHTNSSQPIKSVKTHGKHPLDRPLRGLTTWTNTPRHVSKGSAGVLGKTYWKRRAWMIINVQPEDFNGTGELAPMCAHIAFEMLCTWLEFGRLDVLWTVNMLAGSVTKWNKACDKRLARLISYMYTKHTKHYRQYRIVGNKNSGLQTWIISERFLFGRHPTSTRENMATNRDDTRLH